MTISPAAKQTLNDRLGADTTFPIANTFTSVAGLDLLLQDIQLLLCTVPGERVMRPTFGCNLKNQVWENIDAAAAKGAASIKTAIVTFEPRVQLLNVQSTINRNTGLVVFQVTFLVRATNVQANLVFPYRVGTAVSLV